LSERFHAVELADNQHVTGPQLAQQFIERWSGSLHAACHFQMDTPLNELRHGGMAAPTGRTARKSLAKRRFVELLPERFLMRINTHTPKR
jgi:hypothetical protein